MKKLFLLAIACLCAMASHAERVKIGELYYELNDYYWDENGNYQNGYIATVTYESGETDFAANAGYVTGDLVIPESVEYNGITYPVTGIGDSAFRKCIQMTGVTIPSSVTSIGSNAFCETDLKTVEITSTVTYIGSCLFENCKSLTSVTIGEGIKNITSAMFRGCGKLTSISIPTSVTGIGDYVFEGCSSLEYFDLPNTITSIGSGIFYGCSNLKGVTLPKQIKGIPYSCFSNCNSLESIDIPKDVTSIGEWAFSNCHNLKNVSLPENVKSIGNYAFYNCNNLNSITLPQSLVTIGSSAFYNCNALSEISIPKSVVQIDNSAFNDCRNLRYIYNYSPLTLPINYGYIYNNCEKVGDFVFYDVDSEPKLAHYTTDAAELTLPDDFNSQPYELGYYALANNANLQKITFPKTITKIGIGAFASTALEEFEVPEQITEIGDDAFSSCSNLSSIILPDKLQTIGNNVFSSCSNLSSIILPDKLQTIGNNAFSSCSNLSSIILPDKLQTIGDQAFANNTNLKEITIPATVQSIGETPFYGCNLDYIYNYSQSEIDIYYNKWDDWGNQYREACAKYVFNDMQKDGDYIYTYVHSSPELAFLGDNLNATEIVLPEKVLGQNYGIGHGLFQKMKYLKSVTLPEGLTGIGTNAFDSCVALKSIIIPNSVKKIGDYAFRDCAALESVEMSNTVDSIGVAAFRDCKALKGIELPQTLTVLGREAFYRCQALSSITLPDNIKTIPQSAFYQCNNLSSIHLPDELEVIGYEAFYNCSSIQELILPKNLKEIHDYAFWECYGIRRVYNYSNLNIVKTNDWSSYFGYLGQYAQRIFNDIQIEGDFVFTLVSTDPELSYYTGQEDVLVLPNDINGKGYGIGQIFDAMGGEEGYNSNDYLPSEIVLPENLTYITGHVLRFDALGTVRFKSPIVPTIDSNSFTEMQTIVVPAAAYSDYVDALPDYQYQIVMEGHTDFNITADAKENRSDVIERITNGQDERYAYNVVNLKVSGTINSYDVMAMRNKMINLRNIDLSDAVIVANSYEYRPGCTTSDSIVGPEMFRGLNKLKSVILPKSTKSISSQAFYGCSSINNIIIPEDVTEIGYQAFYDCSNLRDIKFNDGLQILGSYAFFGCSSLKSIVLPEKIETIPYECFGYCSNLESVVFPRKLRNIESYAFSSCYNLKEIQLPTSLKSIGWQSFCNCFGLQEVKIPSSINSIGDNAFENCRNITRIYTWTIAPTNIDQNTFASELFQKATLYVPESGRFLYYYDTQWSQFLNIKTFNEPYEYFYLANNDLLLDEETVRIDGEEGSNPDADMTEGAGLIVEGNEPQNLGEVTVDTSSSLIAYASEQPNISIDRLVINIAIQQDRWYFFCFPFDVPKANIFFNGQFQWCYYDGEYRAEHGSGAWRDAEGDLNANQGYIFIGSKNGTLSIAVDDVDLAAQDAMIALESYAAASAEDASWNLVGNPYTSYYNLADLGYTAPITFWNPETYSYEAYNPEDDDVLLYPYQAFFVQKTEDEDGVGFENEYQTTYLQSQEEENQMAAKRRRLARARHGVERFVCNVELSNGERSDRTRVVFNDESEMHYEIGRDASKFLSNQTAQIYTLDSKNVYYAINERPMAEGVVRLGITTISAGTYTISASRLDTPLYLIDLQTGECTDLSVASYEFDTARGTDNDRLVLSTEPDLTALRDINRDADADAFYYDLRGINRGHDMPTGISIRHDGQKILNR